jgi:hypothetical protein
MKRKFMINGLNTQISENRSNRYKTQSINFRNADAGLVDAYSVWYYLQGGSDKSGIFFFFL